MAYKDLEASKDKIRASRLKWYYANKEKQLAYKTQRKFELAEFINSFRTKCSRCPENDITCLDFHHRNPDEKEITIARVVAQGWSKDRILAEIAKCDVLCSNCHRKLHRAL